MGWFKSLINRGRKFASVDRRTKALVLNAFVLLWIVRVGLWVAPFRVMQNLMRRLGSLDRSGPKRHTAGQISEVVSRCALYVPGANCLPQAMTLDVLLRRDGYRPKLQIGVARGSQGEFQAHAWVEVEGNAHGPGDETIGRFKALPTAFG